MRTELRKASKATPTSANTAPQSVANPKVPANKIIAFTPIAPILF